MDTKEFNLCLEKIRCGETRALEPIYNAFKRLMYFTALKEVNNVTDADDIVSEIFKYILSNASTIGYVENPPAWLTKAVRYSANRSKKNKSKTAYIDDLSQSNFSHAPDIDLKILLCISLKQLTETESDIFDLHYLCGYKYKEISKMLSRPVGTIKRIVHTIRIKLKHLKNIYK